MGRRKRMEWGRGGWEVGVTERRRDCEEGGKILAVLLFWETGGEIVSKLIYGHSVWSRRVQYFLLRVPVRVWASGKRKAGTRYLSGVCAPLCILWY